MTEQSGPRFLTIPQVAEELATSQAQIMALVKRGDLPAIQIGGRGQWRIERGEARGVHRTLLRRERPSVASG